MQPLDADEPTVVGPYRLLGRLGSGGMGRVYLGRSAGGRTVAVKIVHPHFALDEEFRARFRIDFGIARATDGTASLTSTGVSIGSPGYMSPEQILGKGVTGAADVFSLGAVLAYAATGEPPFPGDSSAGRMERRARQPC